MLTTVIKSALTGCNVRLERKLGRAVLWNACLHHVLDLLMEAAVVEKLGPTTGPREKTFPTFETFFNSLSEEEKAEIKAEAADRVTQVAPEDEVTRDFFEATKAFFTNFMAEERPFQRGDYLEFARLIMVSILHAIFIASRY